MIASLITVRLLCKSWRQQPRSKKYEDFIKRALASHYHYDVAFGRVRQLYCGEELTTSQFSWSHLNIR
jgi:hypothetical protein